MVGWGEGGGLSAEGVSTRHEVAPWDGQGLTASSECSELYAPRMDRMLSLLLQAFERFGLSLLVLVLR